jgi:hypothetical protein
MYIRLVFLGLCAIICASTSASALCPPGTVFSAYNGSGICAYIGQGAKVAMRCSSAGSSKTCPSGYDLAHKSTDPKHYYCCPRTIPRSLPSCNAQCDPLLTSVQPKAEANRVHGNCMALCIGNDNGVLICPDGTHLRVGQRDKHC